MKGTKEKKQIVEKDKVKSKDVKHSSAATTTEQAPRTRSTRKGATAEKSAPTSSADPMGEDASKSNRLTLIKTMHEARKREFEQIREELEADDEE